MRAPQGPVEGDRPEPRRPDDLRRRPTLLAGVLERRPRRPLRRGFQGDPVEGPAQHVISDRGDPVAELRVDGELALDAHRDPRRPGFPRELAEPVRIVHPVR